MCLIIHQPAGASTPLDLLRSAAEYNPDGFGFMGFDARGRVRIERSSDIGTVLASTLAKEFAGLECAFHFRRRTRGSSHPENLHPFKLGAGLWLMHNGTAQVPTRIAGRSDTWHLVNDYLAPLLSHRRKLIYDRAFRRILDQWLGPGNRLVILDEEEHRIELLHRAAGVDWEGLWLSNERWVGRNFAGGDSPSSVFRANELTFC
jgi:hypothetical protein